MPELVIGVSNIISSLCSSLIRLEPYTDCSNRCVYCYARWYRSPAQTVVRDRLAALKAFRALARHVYRKGLEPIPARLATLSDPFQRHEELYTMSLRLLRIANEFEYPVVINTKMVLYTREPWRKVLGSLGEKGLAILQISVSTLSERHAKLLEPLAPSPLERLRVASEFCSEHGVPLVVRISPYVPRISLLPGLHEVVDLLRELGVKQVIVEGLRIETQRVDELRKLLGIDSAWEPYSLREVEGLKPVSRISRAVLEREYEVLAKELWRRGIGFATCKEGLFHLHTAENCCGMHMLRKGVWRATLWEFYQVLTCLGKGMAIDELVEKTREEFSRRLWSEELDLYPRFVAKPLRYHERRLLRVLRRGDLLKHVCPDLELRNGTVFALRKPLLTVCRG